MFGWFGKKAHVVDVQATAWNTYVSEMTKYTPDIAKLEQYEFQTLFCPDDMKRGFPNYPMIEESAFVAHGFTKDPFSFWKKDLSEASCGVPLLEKSFKENNIPFAPQIRIKGELHAIRPAQFLKLDAHKQNGVQFVRRRVTILVPTVEIRTFDLGSQYPRPLQGKKTIRLPERVDLVRAWMYIGEPSYWNDQLDAGYSGLKPVPYYDKENKAWLTRYYDYPKVLNKSL